MKWLPREQVKPRIQWLPIAREIPRKGIKWNWAGLDPIPSVRSLAKVFTACQIWNCPKTSSQPMQDETLHWAPIKVILKPLSKKRNAWCFCYQLKVPGSYNYVKRLQIVSFHYLFRSLYRCLQCRVFQSWRLTKHSTGWNWRISSHQWHSSADSVWAGKESLGDNKLTWWSSEAIWQLLSSPPTMCEHRRAAGMHLQISV